jgi:serine/threonine-protein kinase RIO1
LKGTLSEIHGCVSTGKEANVYYARGGAAMSQPKRDRLKAPPRVNQTLPEVRASLLSCTVTRAVAARDGVGACEW